MKTVYQTILLVFVSTITFGQNDIMETTESEDDSNTLNYNPSKEFGAVVTINEQDVLFNAALTLDQVLQGRVAGLYITNPCYGQLNCNPKYSVRGSLGQPLFVLDGTPLFGSDIRFLNINDIDEINILKDIGSTSIYGMRGGNGVIEITSKKG